jgi:hypothetical protein
VATSAFAGRPQPVEIHHRGIWYSGELLGWRHESDGRVSARVRCTVDGLRHSTWKDLAELRLPDPKQPPRREPFPAPLPRPADQDPADETRPHVLFAGLRSRPARPAHVATPPPRQAEPPVEPTVPAREPAAWEERPADYEPTVRTEWRTEWRTHEGSRLTLA